MVRDSDRNIEIDVRDDGSYLDKLDTISIDMGNLDSKLNETLIQFNETLFANSNIETLYNQYISKYQNSFYGF